MKYFPNSVLDTAKVFTETFRLLQNPQADWTCRYIFTLWMSLLVQCPFDLKKVLRLEWASFLNGFIHQTVRNFGLKGAYGKELQSAAILLANFLKRPSETAELESFIHWCSENVSSSEYSLGILTALVQLGKASDDSVLNPHLNSLNQILLQLDTKFQGSGIVVSKLSLKLRSRLVQLEGKMGRSIQLNFFISALKHRDTVIRWTAAKALRRILLLCISNHNGLICKVLLDQLEAEFVAPMGASPQALHGLFLAIGQLLNYKLFKLKDSEGILSDLIIKGLQFDQPKGSYAVGSFVRDAACYVVWSLARYNGISELQDFKIISGLCNMSLFDREVAGRRASSAALQEYIGRIGGNRQKAYLSILSHVHFFSVASLETGFTCNSLKVVHDLPELIPFIIDHLLRISLFNFDRNVRELAAGTLGEFYQYDKNIPEKLVQIIKSSDDLFAVHGSLLALAAIPDAPNSEVISISIQADCISPKSLGADMLLEGFLKLITSVSSKADIADGLHDSHLSNWLQIVSLGLKSKQEALRNTSISALSALNSKYESEMSSFFLSCLTGIERERDVNAQLGFLAALAVCSESFLVKHGGAVVKLLVKVCKTILPINYIEKRCIAIETLDVLMKRGALLIESDLESIKEVLISNLLCDYSIDNRGDIGSKIRMAAIKLARSYPNCYQVKSLLLEQAFGRLDRLRQSATCLLFPQVSEMEELANQLLDPIPLCGAFRGLIYTCGGLDPDTSSRAVNIILQLLAKRGHEEFVSVALSALFEDRLVTSVILTVSKISNNLTVEFLTEFTSIFIEKLIPKTQNIRKLLPAFSLLIQLNATEELEGKFNDFLVDQSENHKFPPIRQLIASSLQNKQ